MFFGFKKFILRGNVVDLAVGIIIGAAFNSVVQALVKDLITPLIAALVHQPDFSKLTFSFHGSTFMYGDFLNAVFSFLIDAIAVYFFVVLPINAFSSRFEKKKGPEEPATKQCPRCLSDIPKGATKCPQCTADLPQGT